MFLEKERVIKSYNDILFNNKLIIFCELNSFNSQKIRELRTELKKNNFYIKNIKKTVFRIFLKKNSNNILMNKILKGPVFICYKKDIDFEKDISTLKMLCNSKFVYCFVLNNIIFNPKSILSLKKKDSFENFLTKYVNFLNFHTFFKLNFYIKQLV